MDFRDAAFPSLGFNQVYRSTRPLTIENSSKVLHMTESVRLQRAYHVQDPRARGSRNTHHHAYA